MKKIILLLTLCFLSISCSTSTLDKKINNKTYDQDVRDLRNSLSNQEFNILIQSLLDAEKRNEIEGKTYREVVDSYVERIEIKEMKKKVFSVLKKKREEDRVEMIKGFFDVNLTNKKFIIKKDKHGNSSDYISYKLNINNKSKRDIRAFSGNLIITDLLDNELKNLEIEIDNEIKSLSNLKVDYVADYIWRGDADKPVKEKEINKLQSKWITKKVVFTDEVSFSKGNIEDFEIKLIDKKYKVSGRQTFETHFYWSFNFINNSNKDIKALQGKIQIKDLFGNNIQMLKFVIDNKIKSLNKIKRTLDFEKFGKSKNWDRIGNKSYKNFKIEWNIDKIIYSEN